MNENPYLQKNKNNPNLQKKKICFEDWDFFSKLGKKSPKFHREENGAEFQPEITEKIPEYV